MNPPLRSSFRHSICLDGQWEFATDPKKVGDAQRWFAADTALPHATTLSVPGCWEAQGIGGPGPSTTSCSRSHHAEDIKGTYIGTAWYRKRVAIPAGWAGKQVWLKIGGVHAQGWFWVNGTRVAHNFCYCGSYKHNVTDLVTPGKDALVVAKVRNDVPSAKGLLSRIARWGGIYRSVELEATPNVLIDDVYATARFDAKGVRLHVRVRSVGGAPALGVEARVSTLDGVKAGRGTGKLALGGAGTNDITLDVALDPFRPWAPEHPHLYRADVVLTRDGKPIDGWAERFGVRKWEVRGGDLYLNNQRYFLRGYGDDFIYPMNLISPASRDEHRRRLRIARDYGFVYVRFHTHCELPEFFQAADELGIMVQPELGYYGPSSSDRGYGFHPKKDLAELIAHYRRHPSLATYCMGNEGHLGSPADREVYELARRLDPTRPVIHQDGGRNTAQNCNVRTGPFRPWKPSAVSRGRKYLGDEFPFVAHEYLNLATTGDPRVASKCTGAVAPRHTFAAFDKQLKRAGLSRAWGLACLDAGDQMQRLYQKRGLEQARLDPRCDGYSFWTIVDVPPWAQGLLTQFWEPKAATPAYFRQFNGPTAILATLRPTSRIVAEGEALRVEWWLSHFGWKPVRDDTLAWRVEAGGNTLASGALPHVTVPNGSVKALGSATIKLPSVIKPTKATLHASLKSAGAPNSWDVWLFPKLAARAEAGKGICATARIHAKLSKRYPSLAAAATAEARDSAVLLTDELNGQALDALEQGKRVVVLRLTGCKPGVRLGWFSVGNQAGTAIARHAAFGTFPNEGYLNEPFFPLLGTGIEMEDEDYRTVEPLVVGTGKRGYLLHVYQARAGKGRLLASGLRLLDDTPEAAWLLDQFIRYVRSDAFAPKGTLDIARLRADWQRRAETLRILSKGLNGWSATLKAAGRSIAPSFAGDLPRSFVRHLAGKHVMVWTTRPVPDKLDRRGTHTFRWIAGTGYLSEPTGAFTLWLGDRKLLEFDAVRRSTTWKSPDGTATLAYHIKAKASRHQDNSGIMELTVPAALVEPGKKATLRVEGARSQSRRWFAIYETP